MVFEKLTLVEFHLETDEFKPSATASVGGGSESRSLGERFRSARSGSDRSRSDRSASARAGSGGWAKFAPVVALIATAGAFAVARRLTRR